MKNKLKIISLLLPVVFYLNGCGHLLNSKQDEYPEFIHNHKAGDKKISISLNFDHVALYDILPIFAHPLNFNYIIKPSKYYKPLTVYINGDFSKDEEWDFFVKVLKHCNASYTVEGTLVTIFPNKKELDEHVFKLSKTEKDKVITITESGPPKKAKSITREELNAMQEKILKK